MKCSLCLCSLALLIGVKLATAEITNLECVQTAPTEYRLSYRFTGDTHEVRILASPDPQGAGTKDEVAKTADTSVVVHAGKVDQRMYFFLQPDHGRIREVSIRHIPLQGTPNFRDVGGYETTDGRFVRWGLLYRSGVLSGLTDADLVYLAQLHVHVVCDFRTPQENNVAPEKWINDPAVRHVSDAIGTQGNNNQSTSVEELLVGNPSPDALRQRFEQMYGRMAIDDAPQFAIAFKEIVDGPLPMLYHCTAGKDRTGIFTALVLRSLGVPESTIDADYHLTETYLTRESQKKMAVASADPALAKLAPDQLQVLMAADPASIHAVMTAIDQKFGSFDEYRRRALHVSDADLEKVKARLLAQ